MRIAICDDEEYIRRQVCALCEKYLKEKQMVYTLQTFNSGEELLAYAEGINLVFLDIAMPGMDGIELKDRLKMIDRNLLIIFLTSHKDMMGYAFGTNVSDFLIKPLQESLFCKALEKAITEFQNNLLIDVGDNKYPIYIKSRDIIYITSDHIYTEVLTITKTYMLRKSLTDWARILPGNSFFRIGNSYLVNMEYIKEIKSKLIMENGEQLNVSRGKKKDFLKAYDEFLKQTARYV
jgi:DNA-binding LytR/AlgR family response regulator